MGSPSIAISVLLSKIIEIYVTKSYSELTPGILKPTDDIFGKKIEEEGEEEEDDDEFDILQTPTPQKVTLDKKDPFDLHEELDLSNLIKTIQDSDLDCDFEMFRAAWGTLAGQYVDYSLKAKTAILRELKTVNYTNGKNGWRVELVDGNIYVWSVHIYEFPSSSQIASGLKEYQKKYNVGSGEVVLEIRFGNYPEEPPHIRVVSPRLQYLTGLVQFDGTICPEFLMRDNWAENKCLAIESIITKLKNVLIENEAKVDNRTFKHYDAKIALNSYVRFGRMNTFVIPTTNSFNEKYFIFSSAFSKRCFDVKVNLKALEKGNKVLLPQEAAQKLFNQQNVELPLIFEIKTKQGQRMYCGVNEFSSPTGNVIVPEWMFNSLFITEGSKVSVRSVKLTAATSLKIQPHSKTFYNISNYKSVLEQTLSRYSCVSEGQSLQVYDENDNIHMVEIVETQPQTAVSVLSDNSGFLEVEIDFVPAIDLDDESELIKMQEEERLKRQQKKEKVKDDITKQNLNERAIKKKNLEAALNSTEKMTLVKIKFPDSSTINQKFPVAAPCSVLYDFVECIEDSRVGWRPLPYTSSKELMLSTTFPKIDIACSDKITLQAAGLSGGSSIVVAETDRFPPDVQ